MMALQVRFGLGTGLQIIMKNDLYKGESINEIADSKSHRVWQQIQDSRTTDNYKKTYKQVNRKGHKEM